MLINRIMIWEIKDLYYLDQSHIISYFNLFMKNFIVLLQCNFVGHAFELTCLFGKSKGFL